MNVLKRIKGKIIKINTQDLSIEEFLQNLAKNDPIYNQDSIDIENYAYDHDYFIANNKLWKWVSKSTELIDNSQTCTISSNLDDTYNVIAQFNENNDLDSDIVSKEIENLNL